MAPAAKKGSSEDVDMILAALPEDRRKVLQKLRETIRSAAPEAEEGISYGVPAFRLHGRPLVSYAAPKEHFSFFPMSPEVLEAHKKDLEGFSTAKGTIRFTSDKPIPAAVVRKIVKARIAEVQERSKR